MTHAAIFATVRFAPGAAPPRRLLSGALCVLAALLTVAPPARAESSREEITREVHKTLPLKAGQRLEGEHSNGGIRLHTHALPEVRVDVRIRVSSSDVEEAKRFADAIAVEIEPSAFGVLVRTRYPDERRIPFAASRQVSFSVDCDILLPETAPVSVRNRFGDVSAEGLKGGAEIRNANGRVLFRGGRGLARLENSFGPLELSGNAGDADVTGANGVLTIADVEGQLSARNRFGRVTIARVKRVTFSGTNSDVSLAVSGAASITTSFGAVDASNVTGDLAVQNNNGPVTATGVSGDAELTASFGPITFSDVKKSVRATGTNSKVSGRRVGGGAIVQNTFGAVELSEVGGPVEVQNTNGAVRLRDIHGSATVQNRFGEVDASGIAGDATISGGNAAVTLANIEGAVDVRNSFGAV